MKYFLLYCSIRYLHAPPLPRTSGVMQVLLIDNLNCFASLMFADYTGKTYERPGRTTGRLRQGCESSDTNTRTGLVGAAAVFPFRFVQKEHVQRVQTYGRRQG